MRLGAEDALVVVDMQYDFLPGGNLAVAGGDEIIEPINALARKFQNVIQTQDWHPADHVSFASNHPGAKPFEVMELPYGPQVLWPDHCIIGTKGAQFSIAMDLPWCRPSCARAIATPSIPTRRSRRTTTRPSPVLRGTCANAASSDCFLPASPPTSASPGAPKTAWIWALNRS